MPLSNEESAELQRIDGVEIFSTGLWNGKQIQDEDLDAIVEAYNANKGVVAPYLKLGHNDDQKLLQSDGLPAAGWVENVRKVGSKLVADFVDIPRKIYQLIRNKAYRKVSCEIYNNVDIEGVKFPKMLGAVALLGAELPGVLNLKDILSVYSQANKYASITKFAVQGGIDIISSATQIHDEAHMEELEVYKSKLEAAEKDLGELKSQVSDKDSEIEKYKRAAEEAQAKLVEAAHKEKVARVDAFVSELQAEKLCSVSMAPLVKALLTEDKDVYSVGEKDVAKTDLVKEILKSAKEAVKVNFSDATKDEQAADKQDLASKIEKYISDNKVDYSTAYRAVTRGLDLKAQPLA